MSVVDIIYSVELIVRQQLKLLLLLLLQLFVFVNYYRYIIRTNTHKLDVYSYVSLFFMK